MNTETKTTTTLTNDLNESLTLVHGYKQDGELLADQRVWIEVTQKQVNQDFRMVSMPLPIGTAKTVLEQTNIPKDMVAAIVNSISEFQTADFQFTTFGREEFTGFLTTSF